MYKKTVLDVWSDSINSGESFDIYSAFSNNKIGTLSKSLLARYTPYVERKSLYTDADKIILPFIDDHIRLFISQVLSPYTVSVSESINNFLCYYLISKYMGFDQTENNMTVDFFCKFFANKIELSVSMLTDIKEWININPDIQRDEIIMRIIKRLSKHIVVTHLKSYDNTFSKLIEILADISDDNICMTIINELYENKNYVNMMMKLHKCNAQDKIDKINAIEKYPSEFILNKLIKYFCLEYSKNQYVRSIMPQLSTLDPIENDHTYEINLDQIIMEPITFIHVTKSSRKNDNKNVIVCRIRFYPNDISPHMKIIHRVINSHYDNYNYSICATDDNNNIISECVADDDNRIIHVYKISSSVKKIFIKIK